MALRWCWFMICLMGHADHLLGLGFGVAVQAARCQADRIGLPASESPWTDAVLEEGLPGMEVSPDLNRDAEAM
ncbi:hypothetical protein ACLOJK_006561 [Asimina triloba]